jgi:hypothetical protein
MYTFKFEGLSKPDAETPYYYGSLPAKPELGHILIIDGTSNHYVVYRIDGEGLTGDKTQDNQRELAWADMLRHESVPTLWLQKIGKQTTARGRSFGVEEVKQYSQKNRGTRLASSSE